MTIDMDESLRRTVWTRYYETWRSCNCRTCTSNCTNWLSIISQLLLHRCTTEWRIDLVWDIMVSLLYGVYLTNMRIRLYSSSPKSRDVNQFQSAFESFSSHVNWCGKSCFESSFSSGIRHLPISLAFFDHVVECNMMFLQLKLKLTMQRKRKSNAMQFSSATERCPIIIFMNESRSSDTQF